MNSAKLSFDDDHPRGPLPPQRGSTLRTGSVFTAVGSLGFLKLNLVVLKQSQGVKSDLFWERVAQHGGGDGGVDAPTRTFLLLTCWSPCPFLGRTARKGLIMLTGGAYGLLGTEVPNLGKGGMRSGFE